MKVVRETLAPYLGSHFGRVLKLDLPFETTCILVEGATSSGPCTPLMLLLPHQLYEHTIERIFREHPEFFEIYVVPVLADHRKMVVKTRLEP